MLLIIISEPPKLPHLVILSPYMIKSQCFMTSAFMLLLLCMSLPTACGMVMTLCLWSGLGLLFSRCSMDPRSPPFSPTYLHSYQCLVTTLLGCLQVTTVATPPYRQFRLHPAIPHVLKVTPHQERSLWVPIPRTKAPHACPRNWRMSKILTCLFSVITLTPH